MATPAASTPRPARLSLLQRLRGRGRVVLIALGILLVVLLVSARALSNFFVDYLWFDSLDRGSVFWGMLRPRIFLYVVFAAAFALFAVLNLVIADKLAPAYFSANMHPLVERFHEYFGHRLRMVRHAVATLLALLVAIPAAGQWQEWLMFRHSKGFGIADGQFGEDVGFYMFKLPFVSFVIGWLFMATVLVILLVLAAHVLNGGLVFTPPRPKVRGATKAHLAILLAVLALIKAADYWVSRYETTTATRGVVRGALYSVVHAQLPAMTLLALIAVLVAGLFVSTLRNGSWKLPVVASGLWVVFAVVGGWVYPSVIQGLVVNPNQKDREAPYIARNVIATRHALGIDDVVRRQVSFGDVTTASLKDQAASLQDVRLVNPTVMRSRFNVDRGQQTGLAINDLDVDRYLIDGRLQQVIVGARELDLNSIGNKSWQGRHLISTHGCGVLIAPANRIDSIGRPAYEEPKLDRPELYVSDSISDYSIVRTGVAPQSCPGQGAAATYDGAAGVQLSSVFRRLAFAISYLDYNLFGSSAINAESRVIDVRRVQDRARKVAPFLSFDGDPYPVVLDGRVKWVVDAYTTSDRYPYSQNADLSQLGAASGLDHPFNYIRNSVKAVVDAYDATVTLYVVDPADPVLEVWRSAFPELFTDGSAMPAGLREHLRYPEDLFRVQTSAYSKYHLAPEQFLDREQAWSVPPAPPMSPSKQVDIAPSTDTDDGSSRSGGGINLANDAAATRFEPYYTMFHAPTADGGVEDPSFQMFRPFVPFSPDDRRPEMRGFMTVGSDPGNYGRLVAWEITGTPPDGPITVESNIESEPEVSRNLTQWNQEGSSVFFGDMQMVPTGAGVLWIRPLYIQPKSAAQPSFRQVVVFANGRVAMGSSLGGALSKLFPGLDLQLGDVVGADDTPTPGGPTPGSSGTDGGVPAGSTVEELLARADQLFQEADAAYEARDLGTYQAKIDEARALIAQALSTSRGETPGAGTSGAGTSGAGADAGGTPGSGSSGPATPGAGTSTG